MKATLTAKVFPLESFSVSSKTANQFLILISSTDDDPRAIESQAGYTGLYYTLIFLLKAIYRTYSC